MTECKKKKCRGCKKIKPITDYYLRKDRSHNKPRPYCKECCNNIVQVRYEFHKRNNPFLHKCTRARSRAQSLKVPFDLTPEYLESIWTGICPVLKKKIYLYQKDRGNNYSAELDRFVPKLGYVKGNVTFLSRRANSLKNSADADELENLLKWMRKFERMHGKNIPA